MQVKFTIIYAYRNRDVERIRLSLLSLKKQVKNNFEVQFIDYGSTENYANQVKAVIDDFSFVTYHYVAHQGLLWNKSKALNYGISKSTTEYIVIADVDVLFASSFTNYLETLANTEQFTLFKIGYLSKEISSKDIEKIAFEAFKPTHFGDTFGIGLFPKEALLKIKGLDTFYHFYGSEDEDLNSRLKIAGYKLNRCEDSLLLHQWHPRYPQEKDEKLTVVPRLSNVQRINQRHFLWQRDEEITIPNQSENWSKCYSKSDLEILNKPDRIVTIHNLKAQVIHFLNYELFAYKGSVIKVIFKEADDYNTLKHKLKKATNKIAQPYLTLKEINDFVLEKIIFEYKDYNYNYMVSDDLNEIEFTISLRNL